MAAWLMVSLKTQTLGPKAATVAPGHREETAAAAGLALAALAAGSANPAAAARAAARTTTRRRRPRLIEPVMALLRAPSGGRTRVDPDPLISGIDDFLNRDMANVTRLIT